jgi:hypothetical protein
LPVNSSSIHPRFLCRARLHWIGWRVIECAGIAAALGAGVGLIIVPILLWRQEPAMIPAVFLLLLGATVGAFWALLHRPSLLQTAMMIDQQLSLHDLLSTAISPQGWVDESFRAVILAQAEAICAGASPSQLVVRRLGRHAWGGIGIVSALLLTLGLMSSAPQVISAQAGSGNDSKTTLNATHTSPQPPSAFSASASASAAQTHRPDESDPTDRTDNLSSQSTRADAQNKGAENDGAGTAAGRSLESRSSRLHSDDTATSDVSADKIGLDSGGGRTGARTGSNGNEAASARQDHSSHHVAPWQSSGWSSDRGSALDDIQSGRIPDEYRDLVRNYFDADSR